MPPGPPADEESDAATRAAIQRTMEQLLVVLEGLKDIKSAVDLELVGDSRPDAKIIPFPVAPRKN
ncbi:MAG TPA: hypothetical protein VFA20_22230 [Myxococcaceae bacterium]|nr:hypothetical protein [Myxococcaceae bacterium]